MSSSSSSSISPTTLMDHSPGVTSGRGAAGSNIWVCEQGLIASEAKLGNMTNILVLFFLHLYSGRLVCFLFKRLGLPRPIVQIITGALVGTVGRKILPYNATRFVGTLSEAAGTAFAFLMGMEMDPKQLWRSRRSPLAFLVSNLAAGVALAAAIQVFLARKLERTAELNLQSLFVTLLIIVANSSSAIIVRMCAEVKIATTEIGRAAIVAALVNDMGCLCIIAFFNSSPEESLLYHMLRLVLLVPPLLCTAAFALRYLARLLNRLHPHRRNIKLSEMILVAFFLIVVSGFADILGFSRMLTSFIMGLCFPREGKTARTLMSELEEVVHTVLLPAYFGFTGAELTFHPGNVKEVSWVAYALATASFVGKMGSTLAAAAFLKMRWVEGLTLGILLNVKGHVDIFVLNTAKDRGIMDNGLFHLILSTIIVVCILTGPMVAFIIRHQRKAKAFDHTGLELAPPGSQLRLLAGVYSPRHLPAILNLVEMSGGGGRYPFAAYLIHLVELTEQTAATLLYDKRLGREEEEDEDEEHGGAEELLINAAADAYTRESGVALHMLKAVSDYRNMHEDVCNAAEDVRASVLVLPFHKHRRLDGTLVVTKEGYRATNKKVMERGRCTVALLVDRGQGHARDPGGVHQQVVALFFGGADDREALSYAARLAGHPSVSVTVVRMVAAEGQEYERGVSMAKDEGVLKAIARLEEEATADDDFLFQYCQRYVTTGLVTYIDKYVKNSADTITALRSMDGMYSLYLVGKSDQGLSPLTAGMSKWQECPELGTIGDLLASSDFITSGSVLVVQQYESSNKDTIEDDEGETIL